MTPLDRVAQRTDPVPMPNVTSPRDSASETGAGTAWAGAARFLEGRVSPGLRAVGPEAFRALLGPLSEPDPAVLPDWAVVPVLPPRPVPASLVRRLLAEATPVFANDGYVVFARRPTFGLPDLRDTGPVRRLAETSLTDDEPERAPAPPRATGGPALGPPSGPTLLEASTPKAAAPPEAAMTPIDTRPAPGIPRGSLTPEALALQVPVPLAQPKATAPIILPPLEAPGQPRAEPALPAAPPAPPVPIPAPAVPPPSIQVAEPPAPRSAPPADETAPPPPRGTLPDRVAALLAHEAGAGLRVATIGPDARRLAEAALPAPAILTPAAEDSPEGGFDAVLLLPGPGAAGPEMTLAARLLRPGGHALAVAENAGSLGRRLAAALGRPPGPPGLRASALRGAAHAAGLVPLRLDGHLLDPWRATADAPPEGLAPHDPASALLEEAGAAAGPRHAAWLLLLSRKD